MKSELIKTSFAFFVPFVYCLILLIKQDFMIRIVIVMVISITACSLIFDQISRSTAGPLPTHKSIQDGAGTWVTI